MQLTTLEEVKEYIKILPSTSGIPKSFDCITPLSGGTANFVYRLVPSSSDDQALILKHAAPYIKSSPHIQFPPARLDFEAAALQTLPRILPDPASEHGNNVYLPNVLYHDSNNAVLITSDVGNRTLKSAYSDLTVNVQVLGTRLGTWLATLHALTPTPSNKEDAVVKDNTIAKSIYRWSYAHLFQSLTEYEVEDGMELAEKINSTFGAMLATDDEVVCHGDFWPGNVLLPLEGSLDEGFPLGIVDWEMNRRGVGATDVGQFAAEAWLLDRFHGGRGLLSSFLKAYVEYPRRDRKEGMKSWVDDRFRERIVVHFGTHLAFWPSRVEWAGKEETRKVILFGAEVMKRAVAEDWVWFQQGDGAVLAELWR